MPTDENTQQTLNQNPVNGSNASLNSGNSDDFDFDFGSDVSPSAGDMNQGRTGMFLTPDEEAQKEELQNSGQAFPVQNEMTQDNNQIFGGNDNSGSLNINVLESGGVNEETTDPTVSDNVDSQDNKFDDKIEDLISFDDETPKAGEGGENKQEDDWLQQEDKKVEETFGSDSVGVNPNIEVNDSPSDIAQNVEDMFSSSSSNNENTFGQSDLGVNSMGNGDGGLGIGADSLQSNSDYVPNEEEFSAMSNLLNSSNVGQVDLNTENDQSDNNLNVDSSVEDTNVGSDTNVEQEQGNSFGVNVNSISQDPVDQQPVQTNIDDQENVAESVNQSEVVDNSLVNGGSMIGDQQSIDDLAMQANLQNQDNIINQQDIQASVEQQIENQDNNNVINPTDGESSVNSVDAINSVDTINPVNQVNPVDQVNPVNPVDSVNSAENPAVDLNSLGTLGGIESSNINNNVENVNNQGGLSLDAILDQEIQNMHVENPVGNVSGINNNQVQSSVSQPVSSQGTTVKKRKKQSGFTVIGIFLGVIVLLCILGFIAIKMFPDKFHKLFKGDVVVEYLVGNEGNTNEQGNIDNAQLGENVVGETNLSNDEQSNGEIVENLDNQTGSIVEGQENQSDEEKNGEELDPNSLAGLLSGEDEGNDTSISGDVVGNQEIIQNENLGGLTGENIDVTEVDNTGNTGEDFDPFSEIDNILGGNESDLDKLNDYISQGNYYKDLGVKNNDKKMERYGEYIVITATEELGKLENGEEIDKTIFGKLDEILESLK